MSTLTSSTSSYPVASSVMISYLISSLLSSSKTSTHRRPTDKKGSKGQGPKPSSSKSQKEEVDVRLYPALVNGAAELEPNARTLFIVDDPSLPG